MSWQTALEALVGQLVEQARKTRQRRVLAITGGAEQCRRAAGPLVAGIEDSLWIGQDAPPGIRAIPGARARGELGREWSRLVFDAFAGFDPEAFGAATGTLRGGGLLVLLAPPLTGWHAFPDPEHGRLAVAPHGPEGVTGRFLARAARLLRDGEVTVVAVDRPLPILPPAPPALPEEEAFPDLACATRDQFLAVAALEQVVSGHRRRPLVLVSDRGRGKTAALGIAAARLLARRPYDIILTAPRLEAAATALAQARDRLTGAQGERGEVVANNGGRLRFVPPDELIRHPHRADLLLVDEAAAIPAPLLERLLARHSRICFATTIHGYEGTGMGFAVRFRRVLDRETPQWRQVELTRPVRWAPNDPLEGLVARLLLLDGEPAPPAALEGAVTDTCRVETLDREALARDERLLGELFGLLVLAHYRTSPLDLRQLLDGPDLTVRVLFHRGRVAGCALVAREGGFDRDLARAIWKAERRPRGHLLAQSLAVHGGLEEAPRLRGERIVRIAVHPAVQGRGLGTKLVAAVVEQAGAEGLDWVGSSFGATGELLAFWSRQGLEAVRLGIKREASSGAHSAMVLKPLSQAGKALCQTARQRFQEHLPLMLADPLQDLEPDLAAILARRQRVPPLELSARDWQDLLSFALAGRGYEVCLVPVWRLTCHALGDPAAPWSVRERDLLVRRVIQRRDWPAVVRELGFQGREAAVRALREAVAGLVRHYGDDEMRQSATDL